MVLGLGAPQAIGAVLAVLVVALIVIIGGALWASFASRQSEPLARGATNIAPSVEQLVSSATD